MINVEELIYGRSDKISVSEVYSFTDDYLASTAIKKLDNVKVEGTLYIADSKIFGRLNINGKMLIEDSITMNYVYYPFSFEFDDEMEEFIQNNQNTLDIMEFLWQNIVLEVPIRYTEVNDYSNFSGNGWKLVGEEDINKSNNPFNVLLDNKDGSD